MTLNETRVASVGNNAAQMCAHMHPFTPTCALLPSCNTDQCLLGCSLGKQSKEHIKPTDLMCGARSLPSR